MTNEISGMVPAMKIANWSGCAWFQVCWMAPVAEDLARTVVIPIGHCRDDGKVMANVDGLVRAMTASYCWLCGVDIG